MKKRKGTIVAILATCICLGFCGCGNNSTNTDKEIEDALNNMSEKGIEKALNEMNSVPGSNNADTDNSTPEPEAVYTVSPDPLDEIVNATLNSGLIQMDNMIFQLGGYITADELVNKYADTYDAIYYKGHAENEGSYEERKDYLIEYEASPWQVDGYSLPPKKDKYEKYSITFTPKEGTNGREFKAYVVNMTNPDEKITLDQAQVYSYGFTTKDVYTNAEYLEWVPMGFGRSTYPIGKSPEQNTVNENYTSADFEEYLISQGFVKDMYVKDKAYSGGNNFYTVYVYGEPNIAGLHPVFKYSFSFNPDSGKLKSVSVAIHSMAVAE